MRSKNQIEKRREIRPPALLIASTGRFVQMPETMYEEAEKELLSLFEWMAQLTADPNGTLEPKRLPWNSLIHVRNAHSSKAMFDYVAHKGWTWGSMQTFLSNNGQGAWFAEEVLARQAETSVKPTSFHI